MRECNQEGIEVIPLVKLAENQQVCQGSLTFCTLLANSADKKLVIFYSSYFSQKTGFNISCKLSPLETIYMKC